VSNHLIIFIKNSELGKVKTRISKSMGDVKALDIYGHLLLKTHDLAVQLNVLRHLYYDAKINVSDQWSNQKFYKYLQEGLSLGDRMQNAFNNIFSKAQSNDVTKVIIIGSDCPYLKSQHIESALEALDLSDIVIGPTFDGGYYLLGMKNFNPEIFRGINWSTDVVYAQTIQAIQQNGLSYLNLQTLNDIDTEKDWIEYQSTLIA